MFLFSCTSTNIQQYADRTPKFDVKQFFDGKLTAHGIVKNRSGKVTRYFNATIDANWDEQNIGTLDEVFEFDDGEIQKRVWTLVPNDNGTYTTSANDVVGSSILTTSGNALFMQYILQIPRNDGTINVDIDDKMYLVGPNVVINESIIRKFGIKFGSIQLVINKAS